MDSDQSLSAIAESLRAAQQRFSERFGAFYSPASFSGAVGGGVGLEELEPMEASFQILSVTTSDELRLYPALQLAADGEPLDGLSEILEILLPAATDGWTVLYWLTSALPDWGNRTPAEILATGKGAERGAMVRLALADAECWAAVGG